MRRILDLRSHVHEKGVRKEERKEGPEAVFTILGLGIEAKDLQSAQIYLDTSKHYGI